MKTSLLFSALLTFFSVTAFAQQTSPRAITEKVGQRVEKRNEENRSALSEGKKAPAEKPVAAPASSAATSSRPAVAVRPSPAKPAKNEAQKKLVDFQKQRAMSGQASAQYDLGLRYLNGDGVEQNAEEARKWIEKAAKQNHTPAVKKLEDMNRPSK